MLERWNTHFSTTVEQELLGWGSLPSWAAAAPPVTPCRHACRAPLLITRLPSIVHACGLACV